MLWSLPGQSNTFNNLPGVSTDFYNDGGQGQKTGFDRYLGAIGLHGPALDWARNNYGQYVSDYLNWYNNLPTSAAKGNTGNPDPNSTYQSSPGSYFTSWLANGGANGLLASYNYLPARQRGATPGLFSPGRLMF